MKAKGHHVNGKKNGVWVYYYKDTVLNPVELTSFGDKRKKDSVVLAVNHTTQKLQLVGSYLNDKKIGEWTFFDFKGNVVQKYNFSKRKLLVDVSIKDTARINRDRKPIFIGGEQSLLGFILEDFTATGVSNDFYDKDSVTIIVSFVVTKDGNVSNCDIHQSNASKTIEKECIRAIQLTDSWWIPGMSTQGEPVDSIYKFRFKFSFRKRPDSFMRVVDMKFSSI